MKTPISKVPAIRAALASIAGLGSAMTGTMREMIRVNAEFEEWQARMKVIGLDAIGQADLDRYVSIVKRLAYISPLFDNQVVLESAQRVATAEVSAGRPLIPEDNRRWAVLVWQEAMANTPEVAYRLHRLENYGISGLRILFPQWLEMAQSLWAEDNS